MITAKKCLEFFGEPTPQFEGDHMRLVSVPAAVSEAIKPLPMKLYVNNLLIVPFMLALNDIVGAGLAGEITEWGGCFNIRYMRGITPPVPSIHSWGIAFDIDMTGNGLGETPTMNPKIVKIFKAQGFDWGGDWKRPDGMHFQLQEKWLTT